MKKEITLRDVKNNYKREYQYQELYRSVDFSQRKPKLSATKYFYIIHVNGFVYGYFSGYLGHMEDHLKEISNKNTILYWLEPESEWFEKFYETGE